MTCARCDRLTKALREIARVAGDHRKRAAEAITKAGGADPKSTPYSDTESEAFAYWRGYRESLVGIVAIANDALREP
jgi:hypothetical protein